MKSIMKSCMFCAVLCANVLWVCLPVGVAFVVAASYSEHSNAQAFRKVVLKHRDAEEVRQIIAPLLPKGSSISVDNNSVLVNTPSNMINSIVSAIRSVDKPQQVLLVSIFRGKYPNKKGIKTHTTDTQINQLETVTTEAGQTIVITERNVVKLTVRDTAYANNENTPLVAIPSVANSATQIVANDNELTVLTDDIIEEEGIDVGTLILNGSGSGEKTVGISARSQESELIDVPTGIHLRVTLAGKDKKGNPRARVAVKAVSASNAVTKGLTSANTSNRGGNAVYNLSTSVETLTTIVLNEWVVISEKNTLSHRPALGANRKVSSTRTSADKQQSVWVKVELQ